MILFCITSPTCHCAAKYYHFCDICCFICEFADNFEKTLQTARFLQFARWCRTVV